MPDHKILTGLTTGFTPVIEAGFSVDDYLPVDLSVNNQLLSEKLMRDPDGFEHYLCELLRGSGKRVAYGGYKEHRALYRRSSLFSGEQLQEHTRDIHIGLDLWAPSGTDVLSVLPGIVHSFRDNNNFGDYGPTIILQHQEQDLTFYTLYGHLSRASLMQLSAGTPVGQGDKIAELGDPSENGNYAPHLHFQIIYDLEGMYGDYPGVTSRTELDHYLRNCPDPNLLLKI